MKRAIVFIDGLSVYHAIDANPEWYIYNGEIRTVSQLAFPEWFRYYHERIVNNPIHNTMALQKTIKEGENLEEFGLAPNPTLLVSMELEPAMPEPRRL